MWTRSKVTEKNNLSFFRFSLRIQRCQKIFPGRSCSFWDVEGCPKVSHHYFVLDTVIKLFIMATWGKMADNLANFHFRNFRWNLFFEILNIILCFKLDPFLISTLKSVTAKNANRKNSKIVLYIGTPNITSGLQNKSSKKKSIKCANHERWVAANKLSVVPPTTLVNLPDTHNNYRPYQLPPFSKSLPLPTKRHSAHIHSIGNTKNFIVLILIFFHYIGGSCFVCYLILP